MVVVFFVSLEHQNCCLICNSICKYYGAIGSKNIEMCVIAEQFISDYWGSLQYKNAVLVVPVHDITVTS